MQRTHGNGNRHMRNRFWLAVAAYVLPTFPLGYFWHLTIFAENYHHLALYRNQVIIPLGLTAMIAQGLLFAWIYPRVFDNRKSWSINALRFGATFGALMFSHPIMRQ